MSFRDWYSFAIFICSVAVFFVGVLIYIFWGAGDL